MPAVRAVTKASSGRSQTVASSRSSTGAHSRSSTRTHSPSSAVAVHLTTTVNSVQSVTAAPSVTATPDARGHSSKIPVGVVIGSIAGGVVLAIVVVLGWTCWRKSFRRDDRAGVVLTTNNKTRRLSKRADWKPFVDKPEKPHLEPDISPDCVNEKTDKVSTPDSIESIRQPSPPQVIFKPANISQPRILRKNRNRKQPIDRKSPLSPIADVDNEAADAPFEEPSLDPFADTNTPIVTAPEPSLDPFADTNTPTVIAPGSVSRKPSTVGSASVYSTQSGEERQYVGSPSFVPAALGPPGLDGPIARPPRSISHKPSNVSSVYSNQSGEERQLGAPSDVSAALSQNRRRLSAYTHSSGSLHSTVEDQLSAAWVRRGARNAEGVNPTQLTRLSQISSTSAYPRVDNRSAVGIADGGNDEVGAK